MQYNAERSAVELSVFELCAMAHRGGSIDARHPSRSNAPSISHEAKEKIQAGESAAYEKAVFLRNTTCHEGIYYTVTGVADGVLVEDHTVLIEELDALHGRLNAPSAEAFSRLCCYAYFLCAARELPVVRLRYRMVDVARDIVYDTCREMTREALKEHYLVLLSRISFFARFEVKRKTVDLPSVTGIRFPYENPREGQTELAESVFRAIRRKRRLFAGAPTGIGKTMSTLYPAVKALGEGMVDRVFYLTAKASTRREAYAAAGKIFEAGAKIRTVVLYAKEQLCFLEGGCKNGANSRCNPVDCPYASGYYDRVGGALAELLSRKNGFPRAIIEEVAQKHRICPHELSLDLSLYCEIIICDYNYVFDPAVYLRRYFDGDGERGKYVFLVDEAHNLPDRARDMYSARLVSEPFIELFAQIDPSDEKLYQAFEEFLRSTDRISLLCTENRQKHEDGTESGYYMNRAPFLKFVEEVENCRRAMDSFLRQNAGHTLEKPLADLSSSLRRFSRIAEYYDDRFLTFAELLHGKLTLQLYCLDPSGVLDAAAARAKAAVFFSATLSPLDYFSDILGGGKNAMTLALPSPYDPENLSVTVVPGVSTRFEDREKSYKRVATYIAAAVSAKAGNYMVYFPSYEYLSRVHEKFSARYPGVECVVQRQGMSAREREDFLSAFPADVGHLRVGFCVLGGSFSEGVDLPGSRLIGTVIVGVGIPGLSNERNILRDYYENKCERGYDYAYTYPGMNRVLQAAGRVIRREDDTGIVVLIDSRYAEEPYLHLYPAHWQNITAAGDAKSLAHRITRFWREIQEKKK